MSDEPTVIEIPVNAFEQNKLGSDSGAVATSEPSGLVAQQWKGKWVSWKTVDPHRLIEDGIYACGGFLGLSQKGGVSQSLDGRYYKEYTYTTVLISEMQYVDRDNNFVTPMDFYRYTRSRVNPVFAADITWQVQKGEETASNELFEEFMKNSDGRGSSYLAAQRYDLTQAVGHDIVFIIMDKLPNGKVIKESRSVVDTNENMIERNENKELVQIGFIDHYEFDDNGNIEYVVVKKYYMENGFCWAQYMIAEYDQNKSWKKLEYEEYGDKKFTGSKIMQAFPIITKYEPNNKTVPQNPTTYPIVAKYVDYHNQQSKHQWLMTTARNPLLTIFTSQRLSTIDGSLGSILELMSDHDQGWPNKPEYAEIKNLTESMADLERTAKELHSLMSDTGVNVTTSNQAQTAESKQYDYKATNDALLWSVEICKAINEKVFEVFEELTGVSGYDYVVNYPDTFYPEETMDPQEMFEMGKNFLEKNYLEAAQEMFKQSFMDTLKGRITRDKMKKLEKEFDKVLLVNKDDDSDLD